MNTLHVFGQAQWHDDAYIVGDETSLRALRDAIDRALASGRDKATSFVNDGEGFDVVVIKADEAVLDRLMLPYNDEIAAEKHGESKIQHWMLNLKK